MKSVHMMCGIQPRVPLFSCDQQHRGCAWVRAKQEIHGMTQHNMAAHSKTEGPTTQGKRVYVQGHSFSIGVHNHTSFCNTVSKQQNTGTSAQFQRQPTAIMSIFLDKKLSGNAGNSGARASVSVMHSNQTSFGWMERAESVVGSPASSDSTSVHGVARCPPSMGVVRSCAAA